MRTIYLDESGKTGTQKYEEEWNFKEQPYFALCGIIVPNEKIEELETSILKICSLYKIQGGEIKSTKKNVKKNIKDITSDILELQQRLNCDIFAEVVNKKYCIATLITDYCIIPYYDVSAEVYASPETAILKVSFANYVYETISDKLLGEFVEFFDSGVQDICKMKELCLMLIQESKNQHIEKCVMETIDSLENYENLGLLKKHVFPLVDYYKGDASAVAVCPHINSFNNILVRVDELDDIKIIHDHVAGFEDAIKKDLRLFGAATCNVVVLFENSKKLGGLQLADFWCGYIRDSVQNYLMESISIPLDIQQILDTKVNFVGPFSESKKLFPSNMENNQRAKWYKEYFGK